MMEESSLDTTSRVKTQLMTEFADVFDTSSQSLSPMKCKPMEIYLQPEIKPFQINTARTIPHSYKAQVKQQLDEMVQEGIIETVTEASEWCHPIVIVPNIKRDPVMR